MKTKIFNRAKVYECASKIICFVMIATVFASLASCEKQYGTTTVSGNVYLSDGGALQGAMVELSGDLSYSSNSLHGTVISNTITNRDGYYEMKFDKDYKTYEIMVYGGETTTGKRWREYHNIIKIILGEDNTVNIYLQLY